MRTLITALSCLLLLAVASGCGDDSEGLKQMGDGLEKTWQGLKTFTTETRDKAVPYFEKQLDGLGDQVAAAKQKAAELGGDASATLQAQWADLSTKMDELKHASGAKWDQAQAAFVAAYAAFEKELEKGKKGK